jgi:hypothetical protein
MRLRGKQLDAFNKALQTGKSEDAIAALQKTCAQAEGVGQAAKRPSSNIDADGVVHAAAAINIIFDGPPGPEAGRFVEVETDDGKSINAGQWSQRPDGLWALRIIALPSKGIS